MGNDDQDRIIASVPSREFFGRTRELELLASGGKDNLQSVVLASGPGFGATELLKQVFDRKFRERAELPIYFSLRRTDQTAERSVRRFLYQVIVQTAAFRLSDSRIIKYSPSIDEVRSLTVKDEWLERICAKLKNGIAATVPEELFASSVGAALGASETGRVTFIFDQLDEAEFIKDGDCLTTTLEQSAEAPGAKFIFAMLRRGQNAFTGVRRLNLNPLDHRSAAKLALTRAADFGVAISERSCDLIAEQVGGRPAYLVSVIRAAAAKELDLASFPNVQSVFTDELIGGSIAGRLNRAIRDAAPDLSSQRAVVRLLHDLFWGGNGGLAIERWPDVTALGDGSERGLSLLIRQEILNVSGRRIEAAKGDPVAAEFIDARFRLENGSGNRALIIGDALTDSLTRAPQVMAGFYRRKSSIDVRQLLAAFDGRKVPAALIDYSKYRDELKGLPKAEVFAALETASDFVRLPLIVQAVTTASLYKPILQVAEPEQSAVGRGFTGRGYAEDEKIAWIAAEIDSKLEAGRELAEFWCDRLEMAALQCDFRRFKIFLIAREGFSPEASEALAARGAFGSSRAQAKLLSGFLTGAGTPPAEKGEQYEIVLPMGGETELIAVHAIEEIAKRHNLDTKSINQIKTALVEACINAAEHSRNLEGKIYQKFTLDSEKIKISVSNRGIRMTDAAAADLEAASQGRRGWGLSLMRRLMDEVTVEDVEDGTTISMVKYLARPA